MKRLFVAASIAVSGISAACDASEHLNESWAVFARSHSVQPASVGVCAAAAKLALPVSVYEVDMPDFNAFAFFPDRIVVSRGAVERASEFELLFILTHELGHLKHKH